MSVPLWHRHGAGVFYRVWLQLWKRMSQCQLLLNVCCKKRSRSAQNCWPCNTTDCLHWCQENDTLVKTSGSFCKNELRMNGCEVFSVLSKPQQLTLLCSHWHALLTANVRRTSATAKQSCLLRFVFIRTCSQLGFAKVCLQVQWKPVLSLTSSINPDSKTASAKLRLNICMWLWRLAPLQPL